MPKTYSFCGKSLTIPSACGIIGIWGIAVERFLKCNAEIKCLVDILPVTFFKISVVYPENLEDADNALFLPRCFNEQKSIAGFRCLLFKSGFKKTSAKFEYAGNIPFVRPEYVMFIRYIAT